MRDSGGLYQVNDCRDSDMRQMVDNLTLQNLVMDYCGGKRKRNTAITSKYPSSATQWIMEPLIEIANIREGFAQEDQLVSLRCVLFCLPIFLFFFFFLLFSVKVDIMSLKFL